MNSELTNNGSGFLENPVEFLLEHTVLTGLVIFLCFILLAYFLESILVLAAGIGLAVVAYVGFKSIMSPYIFLVFTVVGNYFGNTVYIFDNDALIPFSLFQLFYISGLGVLVLHLLYVRQYTIKITGLEAAILLFYILVFFSLIYSPNQAHGFYDAFRMVALTFLPIFILNVIKSEKQIYYLFIVIIIVSLGFGLMAIRNSLLNPEIAVFNALSQGSRLVGRASLGQVDPNVFATFFFLPIIFSICLALTEKSNVKKLLYLGIASVLFLAILSTFSRSSLVAALVMIFLAAVYYRQYKLFAYGFMAIVLAFILIPDLRLSALTVLQRVLDIFAGTRDDSSRIRVMQIFAAVYMFFDSYMLGVGFRGYPVKIFDYFTSYELIGIDEPHNMVYTILAELGLIGFFIFAYIIIKIVLTGHWNIRNSPTPLHMAIAVSTLGAFVAFAVFYQFIGIGFTNNNAWMLFGLIIAQNYLIREQLNPAQPSVKTATDDP